MNSPVVVDLEAIKVDHPTPGPGAVSGEKLMGRVTWDTFLASLSPFFLVILITYRTSFNKIKIDVHTSYKNYYIINS